MHRWRGNRKRAGMAVEAGDGSEELITLSCPFHVDMKIPLIRSIKKKRPSNKITRILLVCSSLSGEGQTDGKLRAETWMLTWLREL